MPKSIVPFLLQPSKELNIVDNPLFELNLSISYMKFFVWAFNLENAEQLSFYFEFDFVVTF